MNKDTRLKYEEKPGRWRTPALAAGIGVLLAGGCFLFYSVVIKGADSGQKRQQGPVYKAVIIPPQQPQPPPPPKLEPSQQKEQMIQETDQTSETKPDDSPADNSDLTTNLTGPGGPDFGLKKGTGGTHIGSGSKAGSRFGWYAGQLRKTIADAVQQNAKARLGAGIVTLRIWADTAGRVTKARIMQSSGSQSLDETLCHEVLEGLVLREPPPSDMPQPINLKINLTRPN